MVQDINNAAHRLPGTHAEDKELVVFTDVIVAVDQARHNDFVAAIEDLGIFIGDQPLDLRSWPNRFNNRAFHVYRPMFQNSFLRGRFANQVTTILE